LHFTVTFGSIFTSENRATIDGPIVVNRAVLVR
jgi:hypothetical protein